MSIRTPTPEQQAAIALRGASVALSAGAGCGKTAVLTERFLSEFNPGDTTSLRPEQVGQVVAITFTDAAAREMRERVRKRCYEHLDAVAGHDPAAISYWTQMLRSLDAARISTIHSFCTSLIRSNAVEAGVDPQFGVLEQGQADAVTAEVIDDTLRGLLADIDADTVDLLTEYSMDDLRGMLTGLLRGRERLNYKDWLGESPESLAAIWSEAHAEKAITAIAARLKGVASRERLKQLAAEGPSPHPTMIERCETILTVLTAWEKDVSPGTFAAEVDQLNEAARIQHVYQWHSAEAKAAFRQAADKVRDAIKKCRPHLVFDDAAARKPARAGLQLLRIAVAVLDRYTARKQELQRLDFDDLLMVAHRLLTAPEPNAVRQRLSSQIRLLLVDEFQDTDPLQVELVRALCDAGLSTGKLFFVGDLKQSIYRFRGAQPQVFADLEASMPAEGQLPLSTNFRSQPAILEFVNALFHNELTSNYQRLKPHRQQVAPRPAIEFLWAQLPEDGLDTSVDARRQEEAEWIARRLRQMLDSPAPILWEKQGPHETARPAKPGDVALLFRALTDVRHYEQALQKYAIPYYLVGGSAFYAQQEVFDVVNLLRAISTPTDALALLGVLRSPFFALPDEALFWLAQHSGGITEGLIAGTIAPDIEPEVRRQVAFARDTLQALRQSKNCMPVAELLDLAIALTGYDAVLLAEFLGERKLANLYKLIEMARSFDATGIFSLEDFIDRLRDSVAEQPREAFAAIHPEAGDVVRLMTIHHSKGLEFPIVVVPDMERSTSSDRKRVVFSSELGPLIAAKGESDESDGLASGLKLHRLLTSQEEEDEIRRLLYVATTRAADYLILSSCPKDVSRPGGSWMHLLARHFDLETGALTEPVPAGYEVPQVAVTRSYPATPFKALESVSRRDLIRTLAKAEHLATQDKGLVPANTGPLPPDPQARRQFSFSQLTGELRRDAPEQAATAAAEYLVAEPVSDALALGTLVHAVLADPELLTGEPSAPQAVRHLVERYAERQGVEQDEELETATKLVSDFTQSPLAARLRAARDSFTELEFLLGWPPEGTAERMTATDDEPYVSGFIDRLWQDATGEWHLLDFKTNRVTSENLASTAAKYEPQMLLYALAIEQNLRVSPKSLTLYFLRTGDEYTFAWNPAARQRVLDRVSAAIAAARLAGLPTA